MVKSREHISLQKGSDNDLQEDSASHEKSADQSQKMSMQLTQSMILITNKLTMMEGKLDTLLNTKEKDGDK